MTMEKPRDVEPLAVARLDTTLTRAQVAHTAHSRAWERVDHLRVEMLAAFAELDRAGEGMKELGVEAHVTMDFPLNEAWMSWRSKKILEGERR